MEGSGEQQGTREEEGRRRRKGFWELGGGKEHQSRRGYKMVRVGRGVKVARSAGANGAVSRKAGG